MTEYRTESTVLNDSVHFEERSATWASAELFGLAGLQLLLVFIAYRLERSNMSILVSESTCAIFLGFLFGGIIRFISPYEALKNGMDPQVLFYGLLPPIILEAGFKMKKRGFFSNFSTILLLSIVGTLISTFITGFILHTLGRYGLITQLTSTEAFLFGSLISAIDPVATLAVFRKHGVPSSLFNLVFGESMLNDSVAIVFFSLFQHLVHMGVSEVTLQECIGVTIKVACIGVGSVLLATFVCCISAYLLKEADPVLHDHPSLEISILLLSAYLSYVAADLTGLSGIVALFFSGVLMSHYHLYNIAKESATALRHLLTTASFLAENFIFLYLGMSVVAYASLLSWDWGFNMITILACLVGRFFNIFPLCYLANMGRKTPITFTHMVVIWFVGLRGAMAFALALNVWTPNSEHTGVIQSSTLFTVTFTTVVFGMGTGPLIGHLGVGTKDPALTVEFDEANDSLIPASENNDKEHKSQYFQFTRDRNESSEYDYSINATGIHAMWRRWDETYFKPLFGGRYRRSNVTSYTHMPKVFIDPHDSSKSVSSILDLTQQHDVDEEI